MQEKVKEKSTDNWYKNERGMSRKEIEKLSASEIVWYINHIAKDTQTHIMWEDCAKWIDYKMREIKKLVSYLEKKNPKK